jgi:hypothetical protein
MGRTGPPTDTVWFDSTNFRSRLSAKLFQKPALVRPVSSAAPCAARTSYRANIPAHKWSSSGNETAKGVRMVQSGAVNRWENAL